jgi:hypothetical protein
MRTKVFIHPARWRATTQLTCKHRLQVKDLCLLATPRALRSPASSQAQVTGSADVDARSCSALVADGCTTDVLDGIRHDDSPFRGAQRGATILDCVDLIVSFVQRGRLFFEFVFANRKNLTLIRKHLTCCRKGLLFFSPRVTPVGGASLGADGDS